MARLKVLPPSLRKRKRYISFKILSEGPVAYEELEQAVWNQFLDAFGEFGVSRIGLWIIKNLYDPNRQIGVIRCNHTFTHRVIAGLGLLSRLGDSRVIVRILKVSGTIKGLNLNNVTI